MKVNIIKTFVIFSIILICAATFSLAQESAKNKSAASKQNSEMKADSNMHMNMKETGTKMDMKDETSLSTKNKVIDLKSIDKNKDGFLYECIMDYDVLSDKPGKDPKCGMKLEKVTISQAKKNLIEHGFKVRN